MEGNVINWRETALPTLSFALSFGEAQNSEESRVTGKVPNL